MRSQGRNGVYSRQSLLIRKRERYHVHAQNGQASPVTDAGARPWARVSRSMLGARTSPKHMQVLRESLPIILNNNVPGRQAAIHGESTSLQQGAHGLNHFRIATEHET